MISSLLKNAKPMTRRQNICWAVFGATCVAITGVLVAYHFWSEDSIRREMSEAGAGIIDVSSITLGCSHEYFWGHYVLLDRPDKIKVWRKVCRDWKEQHWYPAGGL
jgi:hypothetical protein